MRRFLAYLSFLPVAVCAMAQVCVSGRIVEADSKEPLVGASVIIKTPEGKIKKFSTSKADGVFSFDVPDVSGCRLEVSMMGFAKESVSLDSVSFPLAVFMHPGPTLLKEVTVKADRIREQGDTITYSVSSFSQEQDRSIGDVLRRMPGINVEESGKIQYQGEDINKFYIEGSDLLGGKYGIATNGINHEDVGSVEVMENHQPMQVLSGISFSDKAAINLKLKSKSKATWTFHGDAAGGYSWQPAGAIWDGELFAMAVMPDFQNITTFKTNNIGENLSAQATDFFASRRGTDLSRCIGISLPGVPNLSKKRTLFNRSALVSSNCLWKFGSGELKAQLDYSFSRIVADAANITTYFLNDGERVVSENRRGTDRSHSVSGKFIYELNRKTAFINNTLKTDIGWDDVRLGVSGSLNNDQTASLPDYYVANDFKLIKRFKGKHLVTFKSKNEWESLPQALSVASGGDLIRQEIKDRAFHTEESAEYAFSVKGITISLEGGIKGYLRNMNSGLTDLLILSEETFDMTNVVNTNSLTVYAQPEFEYWVRRVNITLSAPLSYARYTFDKALANRNDVYFSPALSIDWKPNNRVSASVSARSGRSPMNLNMIQPGLVMTDWRSFRKGVDSFYNTTSQSVSASLAYKHPRRGLFANGFVMQSWSHNPYTLSQSLYGDYVVYSYSTANSDGQMLMANANIGKTLNFMRGSAKINGSYSRQQSRLISENSTVNSVGTSWSVGLKINGTPARWLSIDYRIDFSSDHLSFNGSGASWLGSLENELLVNIMPRKRWEWRIIGEHYRNELAEGEYKNVFLLDAKAVYKLSKKFELSATLSNLFNRRTYNYKTYNQLTSFESLRYLRGRELLLSISLRK